MKKLLFMVLSCLSLLISNNAYAGDHPEAHFGEFGIKHLSTLAQYQQEYLGKEVMYIPESDKPSYDDETEFKGEFNTPYIISKITGNDERITFLLKSPTTNKKVKFVFNNQYEYYSYGKYTYCITDRYSVPLLNKTKFDEVKKSKIGTVVNERYEIIDMIMGPDVDEDNKYPVPYIVLKNKETERIHKLPYKNSDLYAKMLGQVFESEKVITTYKVVDVVFEKSEYYPYNIEAKFELESSIDGKTKKFRLEDIDNCFDEDLSGAYISILSAVERPANSSKRYGKTTTIEDKGVTKFSYIDDIIGIIIVGTSDQFNFILENVSENTIKVIWNEAVFVDFDGSTSKVMHVGTKYSQKDGDQPATTIIKNAKIVDLAVPTVNVRYSDVLKEWVIDSMYPKEIVSEPGQLRLMLPIQVKDVVNEYTFVFDVKYVYDHPQTLKDNFKKSN